MADTASTEVPRALRAWFIIHFFADIVFAIPLLAAPRLFLTTFGWTMVDPFSARMVGAALVGIGVESYLGRDNGVEAYLGMLRLKVLWSATATVGIGVSMLQGAPVMGWMFFAIFAAFNIVWTTWYRRLKSL